MPGIGIGAAGRWVVGEEVQAAAVLLVFQRTLARYGGGGRVEENQGSKGKVLVGLVWVETWRLHNEQVLAGV